MAFILNCSVYVAFDGMDVPAVVFQNLIHSGEWDLLSGVPGTRTSETDSLKEDDPGFSVPLALTGSEWEENLLFCRIVLQ